MTSLSGKAVLVTGAASGIGLATAALLEDAGALVYRADIAGGVALHLDVTNEEDWKRAVGEIPRLDAFVHSAGIATIGAIEGCELETWRRTLEVNLTGAFL